jgi:hypothetical protein
MRVEATVRLVQPRPGRSSPSVWRARFIFTGLRFGSYHQRTITAGFPDGLEGCGIEEMRNSWSRLIDRRRESVLLCFIAIFLNARTPTKLRNKSANDCHRPLRVRNVTNCFGCRLVHTSESGLTDRRLAHVSAQDKYLPGSSCATALIRGTR